MWNFTSVHNCDTILNINHLVRTRSIASLPCKIVWEIWCYHDRPSPTLATIFGPVSKLRSQASLHNMPFPTAQKSPFSTFSVLSPLACFAANSNVSTHWKHAEGMSLRYDAIFTLWCDFYKPVQNLFSTFSVIWEIIKPYKVGKYLIGFHLQLLYIRYLMTTW